MQELQYSISSTQHIFSSIESSLQVYENILKNLPIVQVMTDVNGNILTINELGEEYFDVPIKDALGKKITDFVNKGLSEKFESFLRANEIKDQIQFKSFFSKESNNSIYWQACKFETFQPSVHTINIFIGTNTKELQADIEYEILQVSRLTAVGTLAAGISHELNNPLAIVLGFISKIERNSDSKFSSDFEKIYKHLNRIEKIVKNLKLFSNDDKGVDFYPLVLHNKVTDIIICNQATLREHQISLSVDIPNNLILIGNPDYIFTLFDTIVTNSIEAVKDVERERKIRIEAKKDKKGFIEVIISDNGCGIEKSLIDRIWDPFFTTKPIGSASGLGLAIAYNIVKIHNGLIEFRSQKGQGSQVSIRFSTS